MAVRKRVRIIKKVKEKDGVWRFLSLDHIGKRYVWDKRPGVYFLEWWEGKKRQRQVAGQSPSEAIEAQRRKRERLPSNALIQSNPAIAPTAPLVAFSRQVPPDKVLTLQGIWRLGPSAQARSIGETGFFAS